MNEPPLHNLLLDLYVELSRTSVLPHSDFITGEVRDHTAPDCGIRLEHDIIPHGRSSHPQWSIGHIAKMNRSKESKNLSKEIGRLKMENGRLRKQLAQNSPGRPEEDKLRFGCT
jgi:hypothetical protein